MGKRYAMNYTVARAFAQAGRPDQGLMAAILARAIADAQGSGQHAAEASFWLWSDDASMLMQSLNYSPEFVRGLLGQPQPTEPPPPVDDGAPTKSHAARRLRRETHGENLVNFYRVNPNATLRRAADHLGVTPGIVSTLVRSLVNTGRIRGTASGGIEVLS